jgi:hypothetical protein
VIYSEEIRQIARTNPIVDACMRHWADPQNGLEQMVIYLAKDLELKQKMLMNYVKLSPHPTLFVGQSDK